MDGSGEGIDCLQHRTITGSVGSLTTNITTLTMWNAFLTILIIFAKIKRLMTKVTSCIATSVGNGSAFVPVVIHFGRNIFALIVPPLSCFYRKLVSDSATTITSPTSLTCHLWNSYLAQFWRPTKK
ncbi:hypothetical protein R3W88_001459 [Solanum pinnatisectum]|uniref:Uncharacterized protein n=1 Tax=Solanum pinnatisectum TaxID=50273 RepID=A0AAV9MKA1_9SOLN|nr:hypothetical protein R3W88_001459 [Solanum pinnatisectum]